MFGLVIFSSHFSNYFYIKLYFDLISVVTKNKHQVKQFEKKSDAPHQHKETLL